MARARRSGLLDGAQLHDLRGLVDDEVAGEREAM